MMNRTQAIWPATAAIPLKPRAPAINPKIRKMSA
jgi:hypothetical protein